MCKVLFDKELWDILVPEKIKCKSNKNRQCKKHSASQRSSVRKESKLIFQVVNGAWPAEYFSIFWFFICIICLWTMLKWVCARSESSQKSLMFVLSTIFFTLVSIKPCPLNESYPMIKIVRDFFNQFQPFVILVSSVNKVLTDYNHELFQQILYNQRKEIGNKKIILLLHCLMILFHGRCDNYNSRFN